MKKLKWIGAVVAAITMLLVAVAGVAHGQRVASYVDKDETVNSTLFSTGKNVEINGTVNGDIFCAGQDVTINATVNGDVICAGTDVTINGTVNGDVRAAGQHVTITSAVGGSLTIAASNFSLDAGAKAGRDITVMGTNANIKGNVGRDAVLTATTGIINGPVGRNVKFNGQSLAIRGDAVIAGKVDYTSTQKAEVSGDAEVKGAVTQTHPDNQRKSWTGFSLGWFLYVLAALLLIALMLVLLAPQGVHKVSEVGMKRWGMSLLIGFFSGFVVVAAIVMLAISVVGIPLLLVLLALWFVLLAVSGPVAGYALGRLLVGSRTKNRIAIMMAGSTALIIAYFLPLFGFLAMLAALWFGLGALILAARRYFPKPRYRTE